MNFKISKYIKPTNYFFKQSRSYQVIVAGIGSFCILMIILTIISMLDESLHDELWKITGFWTLLTLIISSPVAFVIWRFRDENQSKDINLKEFQKIAEWVSGMHFPDNHIEYAESHTSTETTKTIQEHESEPKSEITTHKEYKTTETTKKPANTDLFSKRSGAESLQIAAIYNLLPFYRGDHGTSFEKPAVNLLKSTWEMMQQNLLQQLNELEQDKTKTPEEIAEQQDQICRKLRNRANSPLGQAITRVWMACDHNGNLLIHRHPEIFAGLCLSGMNFGLAGLEIETLCTKLFTGRDEQGNSFDYSNIRLHGVRFPVSIWNANFKNSNLNNANFLGIRLPNADFSGADLDYTNFSYAQLSNTDFSQATLMSANFSQATLETNNFLEANLTNTQFNQSFLCNSKNIDLEFMSEQYLSGLLIENKTLTNLQLSDEQIQILKANEIIILSTNKPIDDLRGKKLFCFNNYSNKSLVFNELHICFDLQETRNNNPSWQFEIEK